MLNWLTGPGGVSVPVPNWPAVIFPLDPSAKCPDDLPYFILESFEDLSNWFRMSQTILGPGGYTLPPSADSLVIVYNGTDHFNAAVPLTAAPAPVAVRTAAAASPAAASPAPARQAHARPGASSVSGAQAGRSTAPRAQTQRDPSGPPPHPMFTTPPTVFPAPCPLGAACKVGQSARRTGFMFLDSTKWSNHALAHARNLERDLSAITVASQPSPSPVDENDEEWLTRTPPSVHDTAFDAYADTDVAGELDSSRLKPVTYIKRKLLPAARHAVNQLLAKASAGEGKVDPRAAAALALLPTDVLSGENSRAGAASRARRGENRGLGLQERVRQSFSGDYDALRAAARARCPPTPDSRGGTPSSETPPEDGGLPSHQRKRFILLTRNRELRRAADALQPAPRAEHNEETFSSLEDLHPPLTRPISEAVLSQEVGPVQVSLDTL